MAAVKPLTVIKGAGDLASGIAYRLFRCGVAVVMTELEMPLVVRRTVSFAAAVFEHAVSIEGVRAELAKSPEHVVDLLKQEVIPVLVDPAAEIVTIMKPQVVIDARMAKRNLGTVINEAPLVVGVGPGFIAGEDVHVVIETCRGHSLGRAIYHGGAIADTTTPGAIDGYTWERLLRAPVDGQLQNGRSIGERVKQGDVVAYVQETPVYAEIAGVIRGLLKDGIFVKQGTKIGDIDPREDVNYNMISDKSLAIGGGVLEAVFRFLTFER